jgi:hypothetical protein
MGINRKTYNSMCGIFAMLTILACVVVFMLAAADEPRFSWRDMTSLRAFSIYPYPTGLSLHPPGSEAANIGPTFIDTVMCDGKSLPGLQYPSTQTRQKIQPCVQGLSIEDRLREFDFRKDCFKNDSEN